VGTIFQERAGKKQAATQALTTWYVDAGNVADLFVEAGMPIPEDVARVLGVDGDEAGTLARSVPAPFSRPAHIPDNWLSIPLESAQPITLVRASLHGVHQPVRVKDLIATVRHIMPERVIGESQVYTIGTRLKRQEVVDYVTGMSWILREPDSGPRVIDGRVWGPRESFSLLEVAVVRREALMEILRVSGPLTRVEILAVLKLSTWAEFSQPLLSKDLETLQDKRVVKKNQMNEKWELLPQAAQEVAATPKRVLARVHRIGATTRG
jgi:hypothetical protein